MKHKTSIFLVFLLLLGFSTAQAGTITYESLFGTVLHNNSDNIGYTFEGTVKTPADVGEFQLTSIPEVIKTFGYCVDIETPIWQGYTYEYKLFDLADLHNGYQAAWLLNRWNNTIDEEEEAIALQLAIWEILYQDDFEYDDQTTSSDVDTFYTTYISSFTNSYNPDDIAGLRFMGADLYIIDPDTQKIVDAQNIIVQVVPEPATMILFGLGLLGLGAVGRKQS
ncbi:MAG: thioester domain-containing protein [Proteobacteria bacterium]|nr:thioester domain-containing protein [Pseudomonadota bacterium]MBU1584870.1 thioester domain-containing protein [Pseudomonadota bacterium]MBU2451884.1 thioester domain-containing protein [Pseudomonadota bacterium]MBU2628756.1 thioester domain-containing protein [Pseudomonadota bacterium]